MTPINGPTTTPLPMPDRQSAPAAEPAVTGGGASADSVFDLSGKATTTLDFGWVDYNGSDNLLEDEVAIPEKENGDSLNGHPLPQLSTDLILNTPGIEHWNWKSKGKLTLKPGSSTLDLTTAIGPDFGLGRSALRMTLGAGGGVVAGSDGINGKLNANLMLYRDGQIDFPFMDLDFDAVGGDDGQFQSWSIADNIVIPIVPDHFAPSLEVSYTETPGETWEDTEGKGHAIHAGLAGTVTMNVRDGNIFQLKNVTIDPSAYVDWSFDGADNLNANGEFGDFGDSFAAGGEIAIGLHRTSVSALEAANLDLTSSATFVVGFDHTSGRPFGEQGFTLADEPWYHRAQYCESGNGILPNGAQVLTIGSDNDDLRQLDVVSNSFHTGLTLNPTFYELFPKLKGQGWKNLGPTLGLNYALTLEEVQGANYIDWSTVEGAESDVNNIRRRTTHNFGLSFGLTGKF